MLLGIRRDALSLAWQTKEHAFMSCTGSAPTASAVAMHADVLVCQAKSAAQPPVLHTGCTTGQQRNRTRLFTRQNRFDIAKSIWQLSYLLQVQDAMAGDLETPGQLEKLAAARSHNKEIIVIASNGAGAKLAFNLVLSLQAQGIAHYIWLTDDPTYCKALFFSPLRVACAWSSYLAVRVSCKACVSI